jgi:hypothetical protein
MVNLERYLWSQFARQGLLESQIYHGNWVEIAKRLKLLARRSHVVFDGDGLFECASLK